MTHHLEAVWPVLDTAHLAHPELLLAEAADDLPRIARQAHAELTGPARLTVRPGRDVPGSGGAPWVVHAVAPAHPMPTRSYWRTAS